MVGSIETCMPFLYPSIFRRQVTLARSTNQALKHIRSLRQDGRKKIRCLSTESNTGSSTVTDNPASFNEPPPLSQERQEHLNPSPDSYSQHPFTDRCTLTVHAGSGGNGCVSFLREKFIEHGPPNGGNGGHGGNIYIQAVRGVTSLNALARRSTVKAGNGRTGKGKSRGGEGGVDTLITVPVGTVVREVWRVDPVRELEEEERLARFRAHDARNRAKNAAADYQDAMADEISRRDRWITYPGLTKIEAASVSVPQRFRSQRPSLFAAQTPAPVRLDLDTPTEQPILLLAGAGGGLGNANFVTTENSRPHIATKGDHGAHMLLELELKMLADVGLVGLPNAGKSTLLRAVSNSRTRVGNWAFTTLQPSIGTVILDDNTGRPSLRAYEKDGRTPRVSFTIADIPGLIPDAHLDRGLGLGFLRHIERAAILAFVLDLAAGDAVTALKSLWHEVSMYESLREQEVSADTQNRVHPHRIAGSSSAPLPELAPPISSKPWFVVATKADLPETRENFATLQMYLERLKHGKEEHPSGRQNGWKKDVVALPVSAIRAEGVEQIPQVIVKLMS